MSNVSNELEFVDTTFRDGPQSNWGMRLSGSMMNQVVDEMDGAGFSAMELHMSKAIMAMSYRFFNEDPWDTYHMWRDRLKTPPHQFTLGSMKGMIATTPPRSIIRLFFDVMDRNCRWDRVCLHANTSNELDREFPWMVPHIKSRGKALITDLVYTVSPRHTDAYYAELTKKSLKWKPDGFKFKDVDGLCTPERARTLFPAIQKAAEGIPLEMHVHNASTHAAEVFMEAMKLGVRRFHTAVPPLAWGTAHPSIFNTINNARYLGLTHQIDLGKLKEVERKMTLMAKQEGLMIGAPIEYDYGQYVHMVPGGVMGTLKFQLQVAGILHKLDEVLEEVPRILKDVGYPIMITPHSQFIVAQATVNVATGERYKEILDPMIDLALGVHGNEDAGVPYMDPNVKDKLLSAPNAKLRKAKHEMELRNEAEDISVEKIRQQRGETDLSDEDFITSYFMGDDEAYKKTRLPGWQPTPKTYYTGGEPLVTLLKELSKEKHVSRLTMQKGNDFFEFRQN